MRRSHWRTLPPPGLVGLPSPEYKRRMKTSRAPQFHEDLSRGQDIVGPSDRAFGVTFAVVFGLVGLWPLLWGGTARLWALGLSVAFLLAALVFPWVLAPLNRVWLKFGLLLHQITTPLILGLIFFLVVLPIGLVMRALGKRPLQLHPERTAVSYWAHREAPVEPGSMRNQF